MYKVQILPKAEEDISTKKRTSPRCAQTVDKAPSCEGAFLVS